MMKQKMIGLLLIPVLPGCVTYTKVKNEPATVKRFQNAEAAHLFYDAEFVGKENTDGGTDQIISFTVVPISWHSRVTDQKRVNDAFRVADLNKNGDLTLSEARNFAQTKRGN